MKKRTFLITALLLLAFVTAKPAGQASNKADGESTQMTIGHSDGNMALNLGLGGMAVIIQGAIQFPAEYMQRLENSKITTVRLAIGDSLTQQDNYIFITDNLDKPFVYKQTVEKLEKGWNHIKLDVPFNITGEELYIGFRYCSSGSPISLDGREDNNLGNWLRLLQNEEQSDIAWQHQHGGSHNIEAIVEGAALPQNDVEMQRVMAKRYAQTGDKMPVNLIVKNAASADINSMEVTYTIEGQEPVTYTIDNLKIGSNKVALVKAGDITIEKNGIYNLDVQINKVNGNDDEYPSDNNGKVENILAKKEYTNRKVLLEHFSTMNCPNCPSAHKTIDDALLYRDDIIHVIHHAGMGQDPLSIPESEQYFFFYQGVNGGSIYAPAAMLDRTNMAAYGAENGNGGGSPAPVFFPQRETFSKIADQQLSKHALVTVEIEKDYNAESRELKVSVSGKIPSGDVSRLKGNDYRVNIFLTEDSIQCKDYPQKGSNEGRDFYHNNTLRKMITNVWGDAIKFENAEFHSRTYTCTLPEEWADKQMHIVAFLSNLDPTDSNNCPIYNANVISLTSKSGTGIESIQSNVQKNTEAYAVDNLLYVNGEYSNAFLYSISGQVLLSIDKSPEVIDIHNLSKGIYILYLDTKNGIETHKFTK